MFITKLQDIERIKKYYPTIHLFGDYYFIRRYSKKARKFALWDICKYDPNKQVVIRENGKEYIVLPPSNEN